MAQDTITLKLLIEDSQIKGATASIDKQSKAIDKNTKKKKQGTQASNRHNKAEKALYQTNLSASKGFSKMNQTMGGSSGVVAAYATLAANVFALTAAFGALSRAAQVTQLEKGLQLMGNQSGRTLSIMADGLREVTGMAISAEEAMRGAAMGVSGGFGGADTSASQSIYAAIRSATLADSIGVSESVAAIKSSLKCSNARTSTSVPANVTGKSNSKAPTMLPKPAHGSPLSSSINC